MRLVLQVPIDNAKGLPIKLRRIGDKNVFDELEPAHVRKPKEHQIENWLAVALPCFGQSKVAKPSEITLPRWPNDLIVKYLLLGIVYETGCLAVAAIHKP